MNDKGIILGIEFKTEELFKEAIYIAMHEFDKVDESMTHCVMRERGKEVLTARNMGLPYIAYSYDKRKLTIFEYNFDLESINKEDYLLFERRNTIHPEPLGIAPLVEASESQRLLEWCNILSEKEIGRKIECITQQEYLSRKDNLELEEPHFIKTVEKGSHHSNLAMVVNDDNRHLLIKSSERPDLERGEGVSMYRYLSKDPSSLLTMHQPSSSYYNEWIGEESFIPPAYISVNGKLMLSEVMNIRSDNLKTLEYRAFIVDGKVSSISRYVDYEETTTPDSVASHAREFAESFKDKLPTAYVADFAETDKGVELVELNPYENSGRYLWNDPIQLFLDVFAISSSTLIATITKQGYFVPEKRKQLSIFD